MSRPTGPPPKLLGQPGALPNAEAGAAEAGRGEAGPPGVAGSPTVGRMGRQWSAEVKLSTAHALALVWVGGMGGGKCLCSKARETNGGFVAQELHHRMLKEWAIQGLEAPDGPRKARMHWQNPSMLLFVCCADSFECCI